MKSNANLLLQELNLLPLQLPTCSCTVCYCLCHFEPYIDL